MKVDVDYDMKGRVHSFFEWIKERVSAPEHAASGDVIADFIDKFLVVEMKRLETAHDIRTACLTVPDSAVEALVQERTRVMVAAAMVNVKDQIDKVFTGRLQAAPKAGVTSEGNMFPIGNGGKPVKVAAPRTLGADGVTSIPAATQAEPVQTTLPVVPASKPVVADGRPTKGSLVPSVIPGKTTQDLTTKRNGNGHLVLKKRGLSDTEKDTIRAQFMARNGEIDDDACLPIHKMMGAEVSIMQVVGFIAYLHKQVGEGKITLSDLASYEAQLSKNGCKYAAYLRRKGIAALKRG
jgi:hypothetical protein